MKEWGIFGTRLELSLAAGRAEAIRKEQLALTPLYIDYIKIQKWSGQVPTTVAGNSSGFMIQLPKDVKE